MNGAEFIWLVMGGAVVAYALTGGADFGGGIWHLFARGPNAARDRRAVEHAIAPIWEANHVWLIFVIVLLFSVFPLAFSAISVSLHIPITLVILGIVFRGASFVFQAYDLRGERFTARWSFIFGIASLATPLFLGDALGALATGQIRWDGTQVTSGFFAGWLTPFALASGVLAACLFALLAATYLAAEAEPELRDGFRKRALVTEGIAGIVAAVVLGLSALDAPVLFETLVRSRVAVLVQVATGAAASVTFTALLGRRYRLARVAVAAQVALVLSGWGLAMRGAIVLPDLRLENAGARPEVLTALIPALGGGAVLLLPSLAYLFRVFKRAA